MNNTFSGFHKKSALQTGDAFLHSGLEEQRSSAHTTCRCYCGDEGCQGGHDDFHHDFKDVFLFGFHNVKV